MNFAKKQLQIPKIEPVKFVQKGNGIIKGYAVNTFHGMVKDYNEDRVSIIMNITKPNYKGRWPKCSYFGVFDGHGGDSCSNFLKDNMHKYITENAHFPSEPISALKVGFKKAEMQFLKLAQSQNPPQRSGSCALVILIIDQICYIANVGDSRAILSTQRGSKTFSISNDHKPDSATQRTRIQKANGKIYQSIIKTKNGMTIPGPFRINPGKLSVSRSFGDIQAKNQKFGGNPNVLIAKPQITYFEINSEVHDFIVLGSDGIFDKLSNQQVVECFWQLHQSRKNSLDYIGEASSRILTQSMKKMSMDNITSLIIVFQDHGKLDLPRKKPKGNKQQSTNDRMYDKQNYQKQGINELKSQRQISNKLIQKMTIRRKSTTYHQLVPLNQNQNDKQSDKQLIRKSSTKVLKKDNTMKVLPTHKYERTQIKDQKHMESMSKLLKAKNIQKIR